MGEAYNACYDSSALTVMVGDTICFELLHQISIRACAIQTPKMAYALHSLCRATARASSDTGLASCMASLNIEKGHASFASCT